MLRRTVISDEQVRDAHRRGRLRLEIGSNDIVTAQAQETAQRLKIDLVDRPLERAPVCKTDATTASRRALYRRNPAWMPPDRVAEQPGRIIFKLAIVGTGGVGSHLAHLVSIRKLAREVSLIDILPGAAESLALDLQHARGITRSLTEFSGSTSMQQASDADVVVVTAGRPRTPGMSRSDLSEVNGRVIRNIGETLAQIASDSVIIVVSNPVDEMTALMLEATQFPRERVIGMAGTLDGARFRYAIAKSAGVPVADVEAMSLGSHGDEMVPVSSRATIRERPLHEFMSEETIDSCRIETVEGGAAVVELKKTGSATFAPVHATLELLEYMCAVRSGAVAASICLKGEYGITDVVLSVPCKLGIQGVTDVVEVQLSDSESNELMRAAQAIRARTGAG